MQKEFVSSIPLPEEIINQIRDLDIELTEGDITEKGYRKKKQNIIKRFLSLSDNTQNNAAYKNNDCKNYSEYLIEENPISKLKPNLIDSVKDSNITDKYINELVSSPKQKRENMTINSNSNQSNNIDSKDQTGFIYSTEEDDESDDSISQNTTCQSKFQKNGFHSQENNNLKGIEMNLKIANDKTHSEKKCITQNEDPHQLYEEKERQEPYAQGSPSHSRSINQEMESELNNSPLKQNSKQTSFTFEVCKEPLMKISKKKGQTPNFCQVAFVPAPHKRNFSNDLSKTTTNSKDIIGSIKISLNEPKQAPSMAKNIQAETINSNNKEITRSSTNFEKTDNSDKISEGVTTSLTSNSEKNSPILLGYSNTKEKTFPKEAKIEIGEKPKPKFYFNGMNDNMNENRKRHVTPRISAKIQQLLNTLKKTEKKQTIDFYKEDESILEGYFDPEIGDKPKSIEGPMEPLWGPQKMFSSQSVSLTSMLHHWGTTAPKWPAISVLEASEKTCLTLTYGKLLKHAIKIAYNLKTTWRSNSSMSSYDDNAFETERTPINATTLPEKIGLIYPNSNPIAFLSAFYGVLLAGMIPVPLEIPLYKKDSIFQRVGIALSLCNVTTILTSTSIIRALPAIFGHHNGIIVETPPRSADLESSDSPYFSSPNPMPEYSDDLTFPSAETPEFTKVNYQRRNKKHVGTTKNIGYSSSLTKKINFDRQKSKRFPHHSTKGGTSYKIKTPQTKNIDNLYRFNNYMMDQSFNYKHSAKQRWRGMKALNTSAITINRIGGAKSKNLGLEISGAKNWPHHTQWWSTDKLDSQKIPRGWLPPTLYFQSSNLNSASPLTLFDHNNQRNSDDIAFIECTYGNDGSVKGCQIPQTAILQQCKLLPEILPFKNGACLINLLDYKREVGMVYSLLTSTYNGVHTIHIPHACVKRNPYCWLNVAAKYKASMIVAKSRHLHSILQSHDSPAFINKTLKDFNLSSIQTLLVVDGWNSYAMSTMQSFYQMFKDYGLTAKAMKSCLFSTQGQTISITDALYDQSSLRINAFSASYGIVKMEKELNSSSFSQTQIIQNQNSPPKRNGLNFRTNASVPFFNSCIVCIKLNLLNTETKNSGIPNNNTAMICAKDEIGQICISNNQSSFSYIGLKGLSQSIFQAKPVHKDGSLVLENSQSFIRTGFYGFVHQHKIYVLGRCDNLMYVRHRIHNIDDLKATILAISPHKFIYKARITIFATHVLCDDRIVLIAEQRYEYTENESFQWMSRVLQTVSQIHGTNIYCLALVQPNHLPKTTLGNIIVSEVKKMFENGSLYPINLVMCPHAAIPNLPNKREKPPDISPGSQYVGNIVRGQRFARTQGLTLNQMGTLEKDPFLQKCHFIMDVLRWRALNFNDAVAYNFVSTKANTNGNIYTFYQIHKQAERFAFSLIDRWGVRFGDHVAILMPSGVDMIAAFYACLYLHLIPIPLQAGVPNDQFALILEISRSKFIITNSVGVKYLNNIIKINDGKIGNMSENANSWITINVDKIGKKPKGWTSQKLLGELGVVIDPEMTAYIDFNVTSSGTIVGTKISHKAIVNLCRSEKCACELYPSRCVAICLDPFSNGLSLNLWCFMGIYAGNTTIIVPTESLETHPWLWIITLSQYKIRDSFCNEDVLIKSFQYFSNQSWDRSTIALSKKSQNLFSMLLSPPSPIMQSDQFLSFRSSELNLSLQMNVNNPPPSILDLSLVRNLIVVGCGRPDAQFLAQFGLLFSALFRLPPKAITASFGSYVNFAIGLQGTTNPSSTHVYIDARSLHYDRISLVEKGSPYSFKVMESGKLLPGVSVVITNPSNNCLCADSHLGEIWVNSLHNATCLYSSAQLCGFLPSHHQGEANVTPIKSPNINTGQNLSNADFECKLALGFDDDRTYARTRYLGFIRRTDMKQSDGSYHDALYVIGSMDESLWIRNMRYFPVDLENTISKCHRHAGPSIVFTWPDNPDFLVAIVELTLPGAALFWLTKQNCISSSSKLSKDDSSKNNYSGGIETLLALDLVPAITNSLLQTHHVVIDVICIVDEGTISNDQNQTNGKKMLLLSNKNLRRAGLFGNNNYYCRQNVRASLREAFLKDALDPIYVAYNM